MASQAMITDFFVILWLTLDLVVALINSLSLLRVS